MEDEGEYCAGALLALTGILGETLSSSVAPVAG